MYIEKEMSPLKTVLSKFTDARVAACDMGRDYAWSKQDVTSFLNSILKGYPIGGLIFWQVDSESEEKAHTRDRLGSLHFAAEYQNLLLDGQQRIATLLWTRYANCGSGTLASLPETERNTWMDGTQLMFDGETMSFGFFDPEQVEMSLLIPAAQLICYEPTGMRKWVEKKVANGFREDAIDAALVALEKAGDKFYEAMIHVSTLHGASPKQAKDVYMNVTQTTPDEADRQFEVMLETKLGSDLTP